MLLPLLHTAISIIILTLSSCATPTTECIQVPTPDQLNTIGHTSTWDMQGRFSAMHNKQIFSGGYTWHQQADHFTITLTGPLGIPVAQIQGNDTLAMISGANQTQPQELNHFLHDSLGFGGDIHLIRDIFLGTNTQNTDNLDLRIQQQYSCIDILPVPEKVILRWHTQDRLTIKTLRWEAETF